MSDPEAPKSGVRLHPLDLLVLVVAVALGCVAYAYLFRTSPVPRPVDPLLGKVVEVEFAVDREWKRDFPVVGEVVRIEDYLKAEVLSCAPAEARGEERRRVRVRVLDRDAQMIEAITLFRTGIYRGMRIRLVARTSEVSGEVVAVQESGEPR